MRQESDKSDTFSNTTVQKRTAIMKDRFLEALGMDRIAGNVLVAANATGVSRDTVYRWRNEDQSFAQKWEDVVRLTIDKKVDLAEDKLDELVRKGNITAIMYTLKRFRPEKWDKKQDNEDVIRSKPLHTCSPRFQKTINRIFSELNSNHTA